METISNIDDILSGSKSNTQPATPEHNNVDEMPLELPDDIENPYDTSEPDDADEAASNINEEEPDSNQETDEYGNRKEPENEVIRDRLSRQARKFQNEIDHLKSQLAQQGASPTIQKAVENFEYDSGNSDDWQQQLSAFIEQTVSSMTIKKEQEQIRAREAEAQREFEIKFRNGMSNFDDFAETINELPFSITNPMTIATRSMDNPAAFLYAAAKRNPQELERISRLKDPYAQIAEMGKLEERMRKGNVSTKAPRPLSNVRDNFVQKPKKKQEEPNGDDLLASADAKRLQNQKIKMRNNR